VNVGLGSVVDFVMSTFTCDVSCVNYAYPHCTLQLLDAFLKCFTSDCGVGSLRD